MNYQFRDFKLNKNILKALNNLKYKVPTKVQENVIPKLLNKDDIVVKSKTGTGKTASFAIPICESIDINKGIQALIIVPTRELAFQVSEEISNIGRLNKIRSISIYGKQPIKEQIISLKQRIHIVVATPGRIIDHIQRGTIDLDKLKFLIIDEADKMLNKEFIKQIDFIFKSIKSKKTVGLFSATIDKDVEYICKNYLNNPISIDIDDDTLKHNKQINESIIKVEENEKYELLKKVIYLENPKSIIIFLNTKDKVSKLYNKMKEDKFLVRQLHGDMSQDKRMHVLKDFKEEKFNILISSDVSSRGIHIDEISLVINYDVPKDKENYIHRIGRTGRKNNFGKAITLVSLQDEKYMNEIIDYIGYELEEINQFDHDKIKYGKSKFEEKCKKILRNKKSKKEENKVHNEITTIYLNAGKKKKIRTLDMVGAISNIDGITGDDIGVIKIEELCSYVDILNYKGERLLKKYKEISIKKKLVKIKRDNLNK